MSAARARSRLRSAMGVRRYRRKASAAHWIRASSSGSESGTKVRSVWPVAGLMVAIVIELLSLPMQAIHTLLRSSIDYAGLFPPAAQDMVTAVEHYARYRAGEDAWALGRFIVPAARLPDFQAAADPYLATSPDGQPWRIAALSAGDLSSDLA